MKLYRLLLWLYPPTFRREYAEDMVALLDQQLQTEGRLRIFGRTALDLLVTLPTSHLEVHMSRSSATPFVIICASVGVAVTVFGGPVGVAAGLLLFGLAALIWFRHRPLVATHVGRWWKLLLSGVALLAALVVVTAIIGELPSGGWYIAMATMFTSFGLIASGIVLGIAGLFRTGLRASGQ